jgi:hypothetical protein
MPIVFWVIVYIESISGATKLVIAQHLDRTHTIHNLSMDYFLTPGEVNLAVGKVYLINGSCVFDPNTTPKVLPPPLLC